MAMFFRSSRTAGWCKAQFRILPLSEWAWTWSQFGILSLGCASEHVVMSSAMLFRRSRTAEWWMDWFEILSLGCASKHADILFCNISRSLLFKRVMSSVKLISSTRNLFVRMYSNAFSCDVIFQCWEIMLDCILFCLHNYLFKRISKEKKNEYKIKNKNINFPTVLKLRSLLTC